MYTQSYIENLFDRFVVYMYDGANGGFLTMRLKKWGPYGEIEFICSRRAVSIFGSMPYSGSSLFSV